MPVARSAFALKTLMQREVRLTNIKSLAINFARTGAGQTSARKFVQESLPIFKFHNDALEVKVDLQPKGTVASVEVNFTDETKHPNVFQTKKLSSEDIFKRVMSLDKEGIPL
jgi:uncharacterized glyoxalase superfamily metalloenzyme YdcJ